MAWSFTGTRRGMTTAQRAAFKALVSNRPDVTRIEHGACQGADRDAHLLTPHMVQSMWPCNAEQMAWAEMVAKPLDILHSIRPPLDRNRLIVRFGARLIAIPRLMKEEIRSGTWATIRFARSIRRPITLIWPDGSMTFEHDPPVDE